MHPTLCVIFKTHIVRRLGVPSMNVHVLRKLYMYIPTSLASNCTQTAHFNKPIVSRPSFTYFSQSDVHVRIQILVTLCHPLSTVLTISDHYFGVSSTFSLFSPSSLTSAHFYLILTFCLNVINHVRTNGCIDQKMTCVQTLSETLHTYLIFLYLFLTIITTCKRISAH